MAGQRPWVAKLVSPPPTCPADTEHLTYSAEFTTAPGRMEIKVCNPTSCDFDDGNTNFNLLVIDAD